MFDVPDVSYARSGGVAVAYQVVGDGPVDVVLVRRELSRHRGVEIDSAGDGFFCRFDGPARAIACARTIVEDARALDLELRAGVHTGECEVVVA